uniref:integrase arm-type DNA-binding domain-containing protein n=1 Tax=Gilliamella sp. Nev6-6 TaxID=3120252 RepID=UPI00211B9140|nr:integrase arm-type DNA-binding domain-containing protein [Gilliamella apicola]
MKAAKAKDKAYTLNDSLELMIKIKPTGAKLKDFRFYWYNKQQLMSFSRYPEINLSDARKLKEETREYVVKGIDPRLQLTIKKNKIAPQEDKNTTPLFSEYALEWKKIKIEKLYIYIGREDALKRRQSTCKYPKLSTQLT